MNRRISITELLGEVLFAAALFYFAYKTAFVGVDYSIHVAKLEGFDFSETAAYLREHPEPLWHLSVAAVHKLLALPVFAKIPLVTGSLQQAAALTSGAYYALMYLVSCQIIKLFETEVKRPLLSFVCFCLHTAAALYVPFFNETPYLGQGSPNVWHNPTTIGVKWVALIVFMLTAAELTRMVKTDFKKHVRILPGILIAVLMVVSNLYKPSLVMVYYPAIFILCLVWLVHYRGRNFLHCLELFVICLPSLALMIRQYMLSFGGSGTGGGLEIAPFKTASLYTPNVLISTLLLLAFPLFMLLVTMIGKHMDMADWFGWLMLLAGLAEKLLLAETGERASHGNFSWGYLLAVYFVWFLAIRDYMCLWQTRSLYAVRVLRVRDHVLCFFATVLLTLHVLSGAYYLYYLIVLGNGI